MTASHLCYVSHWLEWDWAPRAGKRMTVANIFMMNLLWQICTAGSDQMAIQRYLAVRNSREAARSYWISLGSSALIQILLAVVGLFVMAYFTVFPENGLDIVRDADKLFPHFIVSGLPAGLTGLIAAALMAAAMSSLSSGLNSTSTVIQEDILKKMKFFQGKEFSLRSIRIISVILGVTVAFSCSLVGYVQGNLFDVLVKVVNLVVAPLFVLFFMALFVPFATDRATAAAGIISLIAAVLLAPAFRIPSAPSSSKATSTDTSRKCSPSPPPETVDSRDFWSRVTNSGSHTIPPTSSTKERQSISPRFRYPDSASAQQATKLLSPSCGSREHTG